jgi:hypothetical protein
VPEQLPFILQCPAPGKCTYEQNVTFVLTCLATAKKCVFKLPRRIAVQPSKTHVAEARVLKILSFKAFYNTGPSPRGKALTCSVLEDSEGVRVLVSEKLSDDDVRIAADNLGSQFNESASAVNFGSDCCKIYSFLLNARPWRQKTCSVTVFIRLCWFTYTVAYS